MHLLDYPGKVVSGQIIFNGQDLTQASEEDLRAVRGNQIGMIFQEPMTSLNPVFRVGDQIGEALFTHKGFTNEQSRAESLQLLDRVGIPSPERRIDQYPHELSGGMKQRVMIAMALACGAASRASQVEASRDCGVRWGIRGPLLCLNVSPHEKAVQPGPVNVV